MLEFVAEKCLFIGCVSFPLRERKLRNKSTNYLYKVLTKTNFPLYKSEKHSVT